MTLNDAESLYQQALDVGNAYDFPAALRLIEQARASTDDPDLLDRLAITAARGEAELGRHDDAVALCEGVLHRKGSSQRSRGLARSQLGMLAQRSGDAAAAHEHLTAALSLLADAPDQLAGIHMNRGLVHLQHGEAGPAAADFTAAAEHFATAGIEPGRVKASYNVAYTHLLRGDLVAAIRGMDESGPGIAAESVTSAAIVQQDRAEVLLAAGRPHEAVEALRVAAGSFGSEGLGRFQAECELVLARTLVNDDAVHARAVARDASRRFKRHSSATLALRAEAVATIADIAAGTRTATLLSRADALVASLQQERQRQDADQLALHAARLAVRRGDLADASVRLARVRTTSDSPITTRLLAREVRAELAAARGHHGRSRSYARQGLAELHAWQATFGSLDLQTSAVGHGQHLARLGLRGAMADGRPEVVFEWSERARSLASRVTALRPPPDPELAADLTALRVADPDDLATRRRLRERIRAHSWFAAEGTIGEPTDLVTLHSRLAEDDSALVAHIVLDGTITALAVTANDAAVVPLGDAAPVRTLLDRVAADLDFAAQNRGGPMADAVRTSLRADLAGVADVLVRPVLATVGYRRLVLTPSALLSGCPWTELPGLIGRPVTVPTSATQWLNDARAPLRTPREVGFLAGPRLSRAEEEVRRARAAWPRGHVLAGTEADSARAGWLAARTDLLHIAGHGSHPGDHPLFAAVELADGPWFGHDIDLLPRVPEVVVLSACELGQASVLHGEESVGMSAVWLHAGARAVMSSLALVADDLACEVFASWHHLVAEGTAPADALAQVSAETDDVIPFLCFGAGW